MIEEMSFSSLEPVLATTLSLPYCYVPNFYGGSAFPLSMHVVYPAPDPRAPGYPVLLYVAGGGWECCDYSNQLAEMAYFARRGYIVCLVEYRVSNTAPFPAQIIDVKTAIRFVRKNAARFRADPDRIALMGGSAGGHLVSLAGLAPDHPAMTGGQVQGVSDRVQAVVSLYGVMDFEALLAAYGCTDKRQMQPTDCLIKLFGGYPQDKQALVALAAPVNHVTKDAPPFLLLHGDQDAVVPLAQSQALYEGLRRHGVPCELVVLRGAGHATPEFSQTRTLARIADWLDRTLAHEKISG